MRAAVKQRRGVVRLAIVLVAMVLAASACGGGSSTSSTTSTSATGPKWRDRSGTWTVLVYLDADNNLEGAALQDIVQMTEASTTRFVVLVDRIPGYSSADVLGLGDFTDAALLLIEDGAAELLETPGEINMGAPETLASFVSYGLRTHRGEKNALVLWDHGGSWKGVAWDDSSVDPSSTSNVDGLSLDELAAGMRRGLADAGVERFDMVGFDACLMATYEVAMAVQPFADVMVASEETEPSHGWDWASLGTPSSGATTVEFADSILQGYRAEAEASAETEVTLSAVDLHETGVLTAAIDGLADALRAPGVRIGRVGFGRNQAISFGRSPDPAQDYFSVDLGALATELEGIEGMGDAASALHDAVHAIVIRRVSSASDADSTGVAAYFPPVADNFDPAYEKANYAPSWSRALRAYYAAADRVPSSELPTFLDADRVLEVENVLSSNASVELLAKVERGTGGNIIAGSILFGEVGADSDVVEVLGDITAEVAGDTVSGIYGWRYLAIGDGVSSTAAYASVELAAGKRITKITVPVLYTDGQSTETGSLVLDMDEEEILAETFFISSGGGLAAIEPQPGIGFVPLYRSVRLSTGESTWQPTSGTPLLMTSPLTFDFLRLPVGTPVFASLVIEDVKGGSDYVIHRSTAPAE